MDKDTVSTTDPNGHRAVWDRLEYKEVNVKQLQDAAVLIPADLLFTARHLIYQT